MHPTGAVRDTIWDRAAIREALQLRNRDVYLDKEYLFIRASSSKNGRDRIVPISGSAMGCAGIFLPTNSVK